MAETPDKPKANAFEQMFDRPLTQPLEGEDGMGSTLGEDVSVEREREADARHGAQDVEDGEEA